MAREIDINADMGEYNDDIQRAIEAEVMTYISSCSIACGGHAGDAASMTYTTKLAQEHGVSIGAHPSYPDREGFGRKAMAIDHTELGVSLREQIQSLKTILDTMQIPLAHIKPHGALYNAAAKDKALAELIVSIVADVAPQTAIFGPPGSALETAANTHAVVFFAEGFIDRRYQTDGSLTPRSHEGAVIEEDNIRIKQALALAKGEPVAAKTGRLKLRVNTLCIHSDSSGAAETARHVRTALEAENFAIRPPH